MLFENVLNRRGKKTTNIIEIQKPAINELQGGSMYTIKQLYDRSSAEKWAHPELAVQYENLSAKEPVTSNYVFNQEIPLEERAKMAETQAAAYAKMLTDDNPAITRRELIHVPGCPEEPETDAEIVIYRPTSGKKKYPLIYMIPGGGLFITCLEPVPYWTYADRFDCIIALPRYRSAFQGKYPAALNDCHAGYQYLAEHAEELGINAKKMLLAGGSSGSNLAISLAFRLKRYGYSPRGCVTEMSFTDFRPIYATSTIDGGGSWDGKSNFLSGVEYLRTGTIARAEDPEMFPSYATAEDCLGLCPIFMHTDAEEANSGSCRAFMDVLSKAGVYNELHVWGGSCHGSLFNTGMMGGDSDYARRYAAIVGGNIKDCFLYDLRRTWITEESPE